MHPCQSHSDIAPGPTPTVLACPLKYPIKCVFYAVKFDMLCSPTLCHSHSLCIFNLQALPRAQSWRLTGKLRVPPASGREQPGLVGAVGRWGVGAFCGDALADIGSHQASLSEFTGVFGVYGRHLHLLERDDAEIQYVRTLFMELQLL